MQAITVFHDYDELAMALMSHWAQDIINASLRDTGYTIIADRCEGTVYAINHQWQIYATPGYDATPGIPVEIFNLDGEFFNGADPYVHLPVISVAAYAKAMRTWVLRCEKTQGTSIIPNDEPKNPQ